MALGTNGGATILHLNLPYKQAKTIPSAISKTWVGIISVINSPTSIVQMRDSEEAWYGTQGNTKYREIIHHVFIYSLHLYHDKRRKVRSNWC